MKSFLPHVGAAVVNNFVGNTPAVIIDWDQADHQMRIIESEVNELKLAVHTRNYNELRDGVNDGRFTVDGMASRLGINVQEDFDSLMKSMMSKFDSSMEDALTSQAVYAKKGITTEIREGNFDGETMFIQIVSFDQHVGGKDYPKGKYLKSFRFQEPVYLLPPNAVCVTVRLPEVEASVYSHEIDQLMLEILNTSGVGQLNDDLEVVVAQLRCNEQPDGLSFTCPDWTCENEEGDMVFVHRTSGIEFMRLDLNSISSGKINYKQESGFGEVILDLVFVNVPAVALDKLITMQSEGRLVGVGLSVPNAVLFDITEAQDVDEEA